jgi:hypothetical protein
VPVVTSTRLGAPASARPPTLVLERLPEEPDEPDFVAEAPLVGFDAFLPEQRLFGWIRLAADRLTDILNEHAELTLVNVQAERLDDGRLEWLERLRLHRDDLLAVRAGGPRGDPARRLIGRLCPIVVQSGPFLIGGYLHARVGVDPMAEIDSRPAIVPLTSAWLEHWVASQRRRQWAGTILFNRNRAEAIDVVEEADLAFGLTSYPIRPGDTRPADPALPTDDGGADDAWADGA